MKAIRSQRKSHQEKDWIRSFGSTFDLKAVNPSVVVSVDDRMPVQIIEDIQKQGRIVSDSLAKLFKLMGQQD